MLVVAELAHVAPQECGAARNVADGVFGAELMAPVAALAQVAEVVEEGRERPRDEQFRTNALGAVRRAVLIAVHQAAHGERHVEHVLDVVVLRIAGPVRQIAAVVGVRKVGEGALERPRARVRKEAVIETNDLRRYRSGIGGLN